jgi:hypothetical protein
MGKLLLCVGLMLTMYGSGPITGDCRCNSVPLYGRVKVVEHNADFKVRIVTSFQDLSVQKVGAFPDKCGKWQFVESNADFTIQYVNSFSDFKIKFVDAFPGQPNPLR